MEYEDYTAFLDELLKDWPDFYKDQKYRILYMKTVMLVQKGKTVSNPESMTAFLNNIRKNYNILIGVIDIKQKDIFNREELKSFLISKVIQIDARIKLISVQEKGLN